MKSEPQRSSVGSVQVELSKYVTCSLGAKLMEEVKTVGKDMVRGRESKPHVLSDN